MGRVVSQRSIYLTLHMGDLTRSESHHTEVVSNFDENFRIYRARNSKSFDKRIFEKLSHCHRYDKNTENGKNRWT